MLRSTVADSGALGVTGFILGYAVVTLTPAPRAVLSILAGLIWGFCVGVFTVYIGALLGAGAAFLLWVQFAAQLITVATDDLGSLADRMSNSFPWMLALNLADRTQCAKDLLDTARASFATGQAHLAVAELTAWKETATAIAAGLGRSPVEWLDEEEPVERP